MPGLLDPMQQYRGLLQANRQATVPGTGLLSAARTAYQNAQEMPPLRRAALATTPIPVLGDVLGLADDISTMIADERARTPMHFGMSALGLLPFMPGMTVFHGSPHRINNIVESPYKPAGDMVDGLRVGDEIPNTGSISATLTDYDELPGIRSVSLSDFETTKASDLFYAADDMQRVRDLADEIKTSGRIDPLIVVRDDQGLYVLEGGHRLAALDALGKKELPAMIIDESTARSAMGAPMGRFDMEKIGTGEGAQAYGHGIYLAENPGVAKSYQVDLAGDLDVAPEVANRLRALPRVGTQQVDAMSVLAGSSMDLARDPASVADYFRKMAQAPQFPDDATTYRALAEAIDAGEVAASKGHFYTVDLPDEHIAKMLDWDAPLSEQPEGVRNAIAQAASEIPNLYIQAGIDKGVSMQALYHEIGQGLVPDGKSMVDYHAAASDWLSRKGVPGIKYFDGSSRAAGEGTRNFVVFDPSITQILERE